MEWLGNNWIWLALGAGALFMAFGRGGCGMGHGSHGHDAHGEGNDRSPRSRDTTASPPTADLTSGDRALAAEHDARGSHPDQARGRQHAHECCG